MRIHFFTTKLNLKTGGGSHRTLDLKMRYLVSRGHKVTLTTLYPKGNNYPAGLPYEVREESLRGKGFIRLQKAVAEILKREEDNTDIFHLDGQSFIFGGGMYKKAGGLKPVVCYLKGYLPSMGISGWQYQGIPFLKRMYLNARDTLYQKKRFLWDKFFGIGYANRLDVLFVNSPVLCDIYARFGFKRQKLMLLPPFMDVQQMSDGGLSRPPFEKKEGEIHILYTGRIIYDKGVDMLVEAVKDIVKKENIYLHIIGDGRQKDYVASLVEKYGVASRVCLYEWMNQKSIRAWYAYADIFVHPCRWPEPFGRTIVEAMAVGTPVITARDSGSAWAVGDTGHTFENGEEADLREKITLLVCDSDERVRMGERAKKRALEFDYRKIGPKLEWHLERLT